MLLNILFILSVVLIFCWLDTKKDKHFPPGPPWLPLIGNFLLVRKLAKVYKYHHLMWQSLARMYGPVVGLRLGNDKVIIVSGKEAIKEFYNKDEFDGRPDGFFFRVRSFDKRLGLVFVDGHFWETQRKFTMKTLKQLGMGRLGMVENVEREASALLDYIRVKTLDKQPVEVHNIFDVSVLNVMWTFVAGKRFHLEDERLQVLTKLIHDSFRIIDMSGGILNQFPEIRYIMPNLSGYQPLVNTLKPLWVFLKEAIQEIGKYPKHVDKYNSLIEAFLKESMSTNKDPSFTEKQLLSLSLDLFQAGSETTSNTLGFGLIYMLNYPEIAKKVQNELQIIVGFNRLPKLSDRPNLPYTEATINEIQRFSNVAPLGIVHRALSTTKLCGHQIPQNSLAIVLLYSLHMDKNYWKDPEVFRPERFLNESGDTVLQHEYFLPFGLGKRRCMGENLAKSSLFLFFASFMHSFDMILSQNEKLPDIEGLDGITLSPKPFTAVLKDRLM